MSLISRLKNVLPYAMDLCAQWNALRRPKKGTPRITVMDVLQCSAKYYGMRVIDPADSCKSMANMAKGRAMQEAILPFYEQERKMTIKKQYLGLVKAAVHSTKMETFEIISIPDLVDQDLPQKIINIKMHQMNKGLMTMITAEQHKFMRDITGTLMPEIQHIRRTDKIGAVDAFSRFGSYYPAYISDLVELIVNDQFASFPFCAKITAEPKRLCDPKRSLQIKAVLRDGVFDIDVDRGNIEGYWKFFWEYLMSAIWAYTKSNDEPDRLDRDFFDNLVAHEICTHKLTRAYQCLDCPFKKGLGLCKGMPPLRKHRIQFDNELGSFVEYWNQKGMKLPAPPRFTEQETYITDKGQAVQGFTRASWVNSTRWTREVYNAMCVIKKSNPVIFTEIVLKGPFTE